jgi:hypothetical protein
LGHPEAISNKRALHKQISKDAGITLSLHFLNQMITKQDYAHPVDKAIYK